MVLSVSSQPSKTFTAKATFSEKAGRVGSCAIGLAAASSLVAVGTGNVSMDTSVTTTFCCVSLVLALRKVASALIGYEVYPATKFDKEDLRQKGTEACDSLKRGGFTTQKITLKKSGVSYDAMLISHLKTAENRKWSLHAVGNGMAIENSLARVARNNSEKGVNTLLVNGPSVGASGGFPTRYQMGAAFEAALQFLEKDIKATHIIFDGYSLGGAMLAEAVLLHQFDPSIHYLGVFNCTFTSLSKIAKCFVGSIAPIAFSLAGMELDTVAGIKKLEKKSIQHVVVQHTSEENQGDDGIIPDRVSLASALRPSSTRTLLLSPEIMHNRLLPPIIQEALDGKIADFLAS